MNNRYEPLPLFLAAAAFLILGPLFWMRIDAPTDVRETRIYESTRLIRDTYPFLNYGFSRLRAGELPLWNENQLCGTPYLANPRHGLFQPLNLWFYLFDTPRAMVLHSFSSFALMGVFFFVFCRYLSLSPLSAFLGGMAYAFGGTAACAASDPGTLNVLTWTPLLALGMRAASGSNSLAPSIISGILSACMLLSGAILPALTVLGILLLYMLGNMYRKFPFQTGGHLPRIPLVYARFLRNAVLICFTAAALSAVQWIPTVAWAVTLSNPLSAVFPGQFAFPRLADTSGLYYHLFRTRAGDVPVPGYMGMATLLATPFALYYAKQRREALLAALLGSVSLLIAVKTQYHNDSYFSAFAASLFIPAALFFSLLFSMAMDRILTSRRSVRSLYYWTPLLCLVAVFFLLFHLAPSASRGRLIPIGCALLVVLLLRYRWVALLSAAAIALFLFIDLSTAGAHQRIHPISLSISGRPLSPSEKVLLQRIQLDGRVYVHDPRNAWQIHPNMGMSEGLRIVNASGLPLNAEQSFYYAAIVGGKTSEAQEVSQEKDTDGYPSDIPVSLALPLLNPMAARAVLLSDRASIASATTGTLSALSGTALGNGVVYENEAALSRISWVPAWRIALDIEAAVESFRGSTIDLRKECLIAPDEPGRSYVARIVPEARLNESTEQEVGTALPRIILQEDRPEYLRIYVQSSQPGILLLADSYDLGWTARNNNKPVPILKANGLFRGIALPPGEHRVEFYYRPRSFYLGMTISLLAMAALLLIGLSATYTKIRWKKSQNL